MRKRLAAVLLFVCLATTVAAKADTFNARFFYPFTYEPSQTSTTSARSEPATSVADAMKIVRVLMTLVTHLDRLANKEFEDLRAHLHTGGSWDAVLLWSASPTRWPVISAIEAEQEASEPMQGAPDEDSRARLATYREQQVEPSWLQQERYGMVHIPFQFDVRMRR